MVINRPASMLRFEASHRTQSDWDSSKKDEDLWFEEGDCLVYLDSTTTSRRIPNFNIPFAKLQSAPSDFLQSRCQAASPYLEDHPCVDGPQPGASVQSGHQLVVPPPPESSSERAAAYNMTTRNYFAYTTGRPLIGVKLTSTLVELWRRVKAWQTTEPSLEVFLQYCRIQGYLDFVDNPQNALAVLRFAESVRAKSLWIDAFAHCVGMHERLDLSSEYNDLSNTTKALITRASLEMDLHIGRVIRSVGNLLENELSDEKLGLSKAARDHLDHFRGFLHTYFLERLGYFPPNNSENHFDKDVWTELHDDFHRLYDYLVDKESKNDLLSNRGVIGGVCVLQNVHAFNQRHKYEPLPHPLPLLPDLTSLRRATDTQKSIRTFKRSRSESEPRVSAGQALAKASNSDHDTLLSNTIVQEYIRFERQKVEGKLSIAEARNVRWILIYSALQMLRSVTRAPKEVEDSSSSSYPLCVLTTGCPPWAPLEEAEGLELSDLHSVPASPVSSHSEEADQSDDGDAVSAAAAAAGDDSAERISIHPDCEADSAQDFFSTSTFSRKASQIDREEDEEEDVPQPLPNTYPISRTASIRSSVHLSMNALHKSVVGSLSMRNSLRKLPASPVLKRSPSFCEIVVEGYGNGALAEGSDRAEAARQLDGIAPTPSALADFDFGLEHSVSGATSPVKFASVPLVEEQQLRHPVWSSGRDIVAAPGIPSDESHSPTSDISPRDSSYLSDCDTPITEYSSRSNSTREGNLSTVPSSVDMDKLTSTLSRRPLNPNASSSSSLNVGCYVPSGLTSFELPVSRFSSTQRRKVFRQTRESPVGSVATFPGSMSAGDVARMTDIEIGRSTARRRSRVLDYVGRAGIVG